MNDPNTDDRNIYRDPELIWKHYDEMMKQSDPDEDYFPGLERYSPARFKRELMVFRIGHLASRIVEVGEKIELPTNSILHVLDNAGYPEDQWGDIPRTDENVFIQHETYRKYLYHQRDLNLDGGPIQVTDKFIYRYAGLPRNLMSFKSHTGSKFRYCNTMEELPDTKTTLIVVNHNPAFRTRIVSGNMRFFRRIQLILASVLNTVHQFAPLGRQQFIMLPWGTECYERNLFMRNRELITKSTVKYPESFHYILMMHLVNFMWDSATTSFFKRMPREEWDQINLILQCGEKYVFYNLADLAAINERNIAYVRFINQLNMLSVLGRVDGNDGAATALAEQHFTKLSDTDLAEQDLDKDLVEAVYVTKDTEDAAVVPNGDNDRASIAQDSKEESAIARAADAITEVAPAPVKYVASTVVSAVSPIAPVTEKSIHGATTHVARRVNESAAEPAEITNPALTYMQEQEQMADEFIDNDPELTPKQKQRAKILARKYRDLEVHGRKIADIIRNDTDTSIDLDPIPEEVLGIRPPDSSALSSAPLAYDRAYMAKSFDKHFVGAITSFQRNGAYLVGLKENKVTTQLNCYTEYTLQFEDIRGKKSSIKLRVPIVRNDGRVVIDGIPKVLRKQRVTLPIVKTSETTVSLSSNYNKTQVIRNTTKAHNFFSYIDSIVNTPKSTAAVVFGNCAIRDILLSYEYTQLADKYKSIVFTNNGEKWSLWFDYHTREEHAAIKREKLEQLEAEYGVYFGRNSTDLLFVNPQNEVNAVKMSGGEDTEFPYHSITDICVLSRRDDGGFDPIAKPLTEWVSIKILDKMLPVAFMLAYRYGLRGMLEYLGIKYTITERRSKVIIGTDSAAGAEDFSIPSMEAASTAPETPAVLREIYRKVAGCKYGFWDSSTDKLMERADENNNEYLNKNARILTPQEVLKYKVGTCWDQSLALAYLLSQAGIEFTYFFMEKPSNETHTFVVAEVDNKYYWLETAWSRHRGIHAASSESQVLSLASDNFFKTAEDARRGFTETISPATVKSCWQNKNLRIAQFLKLMKFVDFAPQEGNESFGTDSGVAGNESMGSFRYPAPEQLTNRLLQSVGHKVKLQMKALYHFDVDNVELKVSRQNFYDNGKPRNTDAYNAWAGCYVRTTNTVYINEQFAAVMRNWFVEQVVYYDNYVRFLYWMIAHELTHSCYNNVKYTNTFNKIEAAAKNRNFTTVYLEGISKTAPNYREELCCEYVASQMKQIVVGNESFGAGIDNILDADGVVDDRYFGTDWIKFANQVDEEDDHVEEKEFPATEDAGTEIRYAPQPGDIALKFADRILWINRYPLAQSLVVAGLAALNINDYEMSAFESKDIYYQLLQDQGLSTNYLKGIDSFYDLFVDNMTYGVLVSMHEPTNVRDLLIRCAELLSTMDYRQPSSRVNHRIRGYEQFNAVIYNEMARQFAAYQARRGNANTFSVNPQAIYLRLISNASLVPSDNPNPITDLKEQASMTYVGHGGRTAESFVLKDRKFAEDDVGVISEATVDNGKVGINAQLSFNAGIVDTNGKLQPADKLEAGNVLSATGCIFPFATKDDSKRLNFISIQSSHYVPAVVTEPSRVRTGYERIVAHRVGKEFAGIAQQDGKITNIDEKAQLIEITYEDGTADVFPIGERYSEFQGVCVTQELVPVVKLGDKLKKGEVITYNKGFFNLDPRSKQLDFSVGLNANVAMIEMDVNLEDASEISPDLARRITIKPTVQRFVTLSAKSLVHKCVQVGDEVATNDRLMVFEEDTSLDNASEMRVDEETMSLLSDLNSRIPKAKTAGRVVKIEAFYSCELSDMHPTLASIVREATAAANKASRLASRTESADDYAPSAPLPVGTKYRGTTFDEDTVMLGFYIQETEHTTIGDKIVVGLQLKNTISSIMPQPYYTEEGVPIDVMFSASSANRRIVTSPSLLGISNRIMEKLEHDVVNMYFDQ